MAVAVLAAGCAAITCGAAGSTPFSLNSYSQTWGVALIITPSYGWLHGP
ncbi:MAG TPA: hypothetical protein VKZ18_11740 [Polyangia bacterium]|nr:hypothetical protein [Polyangia bacterium]